MLMIYLLEMFIWGNCRCDIGCTVLFYFPFLEETAQRGDGECRLMRQAECILRAHDLWGKIGKIVPMSAPRGARSSSTSIYGLGFPERLPGRVDTLKTARGRARGDAGSLGRLPDVPPRPVDVADL